MSLVTEIAGRVLRLPAPQTRSLVIERDLQVPMPDGAVLLADRWVPRGVESPPTVLVRSPYGRRAWVGLVYGRLFAERGFQVVVQSVRGTFGSGGEFDPMDERADGLATLEWLARQPWHRGKVGMVGASYLGIVQWAVARDAGDAIGALSLQVTASRVGGMANAGGVMALDLALSWLYVVSVQETPLGYARMPLGLRRRLPRLYSHLPLSELDTLATGREVGFFREWLDGVGGDSPYWQARDYSAGVGEVEAPVQLIGGWQDIFLPWLLEDYAALRAAGRRPQLVIGPWSHISPGLLARGLREALGWMRAHLLGDRRLLHEAPVRAYVSGAREWRELEDWPPPGAREMRLFLGPGLQLGGEPDRFRYDPADPTPAFGGPLLMDPRAVVDNRALEERPDVLVYTGAVLCEPLELLGPVSAEIWFRSSLDFFDVFVRLCDVDESGVSLNVCDGLVRVEPGRFERDGDGVTRVPVEMWPAARRFAAGHRLRVQVSSGAHPRYARNTGTGEPLATATRLVAAEQEVFHDAARPSAITVNVPE